MIRIPKKEDVRKILIIGHSNIGDIAIDALFLKPLRRLYPRAQISFITSPKAKDLLSCYQGIDHQIILDKRGQHRGFFGRLRFHNELHKGHFDLVLVLVKTFMHKFLAIPCVWDIRAAHNRDYLEKRIHPIDIYKKFLQSAGIELQKPYFNFDLDSEQPFCDEFLKSQGVMPQEPLIGILPLAAWGLKNWPIQKWNELARTLLKTHGLKTLAFGRTTGDEIGKNVVKNISPEIISAIDQTNLKQTLLLIKRCSLFIGPDSSLLHLASNLGVESVGLYGPTPADYVYPYFHRQNIIGPKHVSEQYACYRDQHHCACRDGLEPGACMKALSVDEVLEFITTKKILPKRISI